MKYFILAALLAICTYSYGQKKGPFTALKYDSVILYGYLPPHNNPYILDTGGRLNPTVYNSARLSSADVAELSAKLEDKASYGGHPAKCFLPYLAIIYYKAGRSVANIVISPHCDWIVFGQQKPIFFKYDRTGMTDEFRQYFLDMEVKYGIQRQQK